MTRALCALVLLAACASAYEIDERENEEPPKNMPISPHDGLEALPYVGASDVVFLRGPSAQLLNLEGTGPKQIQWAPEDRRAMDIEIRARIVNIDGIDPLVPEPQDPPLVRWNIEVSHGQYVWHDPLLQLPYHGAPQSIQQSAMPARGLQFRVTSRETRMQFQMQGTVKGVRVPPFPAVTVSLSFIPVIGETLPLYPTQNFGNAFSVSDPAFGDTIGIPASATEFRVFDADGKPFAAVGGLTFVGLVSDLYGTGTLATYANFTPIPFNAVGMFSGTHDIYVEFR